MDTWTDDIETVLKSIHNNCITNARNHKKRYFYLKGYLKYFRIPTIVISGVNSVCSVGLQPYVAQTNISILTCALALICGIIASIESYLQIQASTESDLMAAKDFQLLAADIYKMLTLDRDNRGVGGISYLDETFGIYCKYIEGSQPLDKNIRNFLQLDIEISNYGNGNGSSNGNTSGYTTDQSDGDGSVYSTVTRRTAAIALGMSEPLISALRISSRGSSGSGGSGGSSVSTASTSSSQHTLNNTNANRDIANQGIPMNTNQTEYNEAVTDTTNQTVLESLRRVYQTELTPSNITIDLEQGIDLKSRD